MTAIRLGQPVQAPPLRCTACGRDRAPGQLLRVDDLVSGASFAVCRPGLGQAPARSANGYLEPSCFRATVSAADRHRIAWAVDGTNDGCPT